MKITNLFTSLKVLVAASVGGGLEMYDFVMYIFFAPTIAALFFPEDNHYIGMLATYGIFAIGYFMRPLGGLIFGYLGDKTGRKKWLLVSILLMGFSTLAMGCLPSYQTIGIAAPILLTLLRLLQGIAVGADLPGGITFVVEHAASKTRGFNCGMVFLGVNTGLLGASAAAAVITGFWTDAELRDWGWRIGFWSSALLVVLGYYLRRGLAESAVFLGARKARQLVKNPLRTLLTAEHLPVIFIGISLVWLHAVLIVQLFMEMPTFLSQHSIKTMDEALYLNTASLAILSLLIPLMGLLSDHIGRKRTLAMGATLFLLCSYPLYLLLISESITQVMIGLLVLDILSAMIVGVVPVTLSELFGTEHRYSGVALTYNIGFAIFAGLTPMVLTLLEKLFQSPAIGALNIIVAAAVCLLGVYFTKNKVRDTL